MLLSDFQMMLPPLDTTVLEPHFDLWRINENGSRYRSQNGGLLVLLLTEEYAQDKASRVRPNVGRNVSIKAFSGLTVRSPCTAASRTQLRASPIALA